MIPKFRGHQYINIAHIFTVISYLKFTKQLLVLVDQNHFPIQPRFEEGDFRVLQIAIGSLIIRYSFIGTLLMIALIWSMIMCSNHID